MAEALRDKQILLVLSKPPVPEIDGGCVAIAASVKLWIKAGYKPYIFCLHTPKHPFTKQTRDFFLNSGLRFYPAFVDTRTKPLHFLYALRYSLPLRAARFYSKKVGNQLTEICNTHNITHVVWEGLYAAVYEKDIPVSCSQGLRSHNVEYKIWESLSIKSFKDLIIKADNIRLKNWESKLFLRMKKIWAISPEDQQQIEAHAPKTAVDFLPIPFEPESKPHNFSSKGINIYHLGAMDWLPNRAGMEEFLFKVWPQIHTKVPDSKLHLGGKAFPEEWKNLAIPGVVFHGQVNIPVSEWLSDKDLLLVPIKLAGGVRVKIIEAAAAGIPIIATPEALSGLPPQIRSLCKEVTENQDWALKISEWVNYKISWREHSEKLREGVSEVYAYENQTSKLNF
jgi:polysaccharide biosynthesis protein PslH